MQHLFFNCISVKKVIKEIEAIFSISGLTAKYRNQGGKYGKYVTKPLLALSSHTQKY